MTPGCLIWATGRMEFKEMRREDYERGVVDQKFSFGYMLDMLIVRSQCSC